MSSVMNKHQLAEARGLFLRDTCLRYNSGNRSVDPEIVATGMPGCMMRAPGTCGCAIGFHLSAELCAELDAMEDTFVDLDEVWNKLPDWMVALGRGFLRECQELHDMPKYWDEFGLSLVGLEWAMEICDGHGIIWPIGGAR